MKLEGVVHNGVIIPDDASALAEGTRVRISPLANDGPKPSTEDQPQPFGQRFAQFKGAAPGLPTDLADQHDRYRLGTPNR
jgi:hypothetical protein